MKNVFDGHISRLDMAKIHDQTATKDIKYM